MTKLVVFMVIWFDYIPATDYKVGWDWVEARGRRDSQSRPFLGPRRDETLVSVSSQAFPESQSQSQVSNFLQPWSQSQSRG